MTRVNSRSFETTNDSLHSNSNRESAIGAKIDEKKFLQLINFVLRIAKRFKIPAIASPQNVTGNAKKPDDERT